MERSETTNILSLPRDALDLVALKLDPEELINWCKSNKRFTKLCSPEEWIKRTKRDFGEDSYIRVYSNEIRNYKAAQVRDFIKKYWIGRRPEFVDKAEAISKELANYLVKTAPRDFEIVRRNVAFGDISSKYSDFKEGRITLFYGSSGHEYATVVIFEYVNNGTPVYIMGWHPVTSINGDPTNPRLISHINMPEEFYTFIYRFGVTAKDASTLYQTNIYYFNNPLY